MQSRTERPDAVVDAPKGNWVDTVAPPAWRPWLRLSRADRPIGTWLLLLPCWWGIGLAMMADGPRWLDLWIAIACGIGALVMRGAGCTWNDITDRDIDDKVARTRSRPLPSGQVTLRGAYGWLVAQGLVGFAILLTLDPAAIWMGVASLALVAIYPFAKRLTWWPQVFLGLAFNWGVLLAATTIDADKPGHVVPHDDRVALFDDGTGTVRILRTDALGDVDTDQVRPRTGLTPRPRDGGEGEQEHRKHHSGRRRHRP